eukprot:gene9413-11077_t
MSVHGNLVGRLVQLRNIVSKPELNEAYVLVQAYLPDRDRFSVRTLPSPNSENSGAHIAVRLDSLVLCSGDSFVDKYLTVQEVQVDSLANAVRDHPDGTTLKLNSMQLPESVVLKKSHRCVGEKVALNSAGIPEPVTKYLGNVHIAPTSDDAILEFEDIHFIGFENRSHDYVTCTSGFTTFRRCVFTNMQIIVAGNDSITTTQLSPAYVAHRVSELLGTPNVVFESCVMEAIILKAETTGVCAGNDGTVTLLNCVIRNSGGGVLSTAGSTVVMRHCLIENCVSGVGVGEKTRSIDMQHCNIAKYLGFNWFGGYGILLDTVGSAVVRDCRVRRGLEFGIYLRGKSKHLNCVAISDCLVSGCQNGMYFQFGEFKAIINTTTLQCNLKHALCIDPAVIGSVVLNKCRFLQSMVSHVLNRSPAKGLLTIDGVVQAAVNTEQTHKSPDHLAARRCGQRAGICDINCAHCGKKEEAMRRIHEGTLSVDGLREVVQKCDPDMR